MKIASWNVNSLTVRLPQVLEWLEQSQVDVLCLQELKMETHKFPNAAFQEIAYQAVWSGQKTYNGVAILSKAPFQSVQINNPLYEDVQQRLLAIELETAHGPIRIIDVYCPNGGSLDSDKFVYKMQWFNALHAYIKEQLVKYPFLILTGDFNIAPENIDIHAKYTGDILVSPPERAQFKALLDLGLHDSFRLFEQEPKSFSWWDYRHFGFKRNAGLRIDHVLISNALKPHCTHSLIDKIPRAWDRPSDHTPVMAQFVL